jgi:hypothetical protein
VGRVIRAVLAFLGLALAGMVAILAGLVWDAVLHARDPAATHSEQSLFNLSNPPHALLAIGGIVTVIGLSGAMVRALSLSTGRRLSSPRLSALVLVGSLVAVAATGGALQWVSTLRPPIATGPLAPTDGPDVHSSSVLSSHAPGDCRPSSADKAGAAKLLADTEVGTAKYRSFAAAQADGYVGPTDSLLTQHFFSVANVEDGRVLDTNRPEALMYTATSHGPVLVGVMYMTNVPGEFGPQPGGCLTRWHVHTDVCLDLVTEALSEMSVPTAGCAPPLIHYIPPPLLHVWLVDVPGGRFAAEVDAKYLQQTVGP